MSASNVEDGSKLPSFRFVTHAPSRFERVRSAWGLSLPNYAESFALEMRVRNGDRLESRDAKNAEKNASTTASKDGTTPRHARDFSVAPGAGALSLTDEGADPRASTESGRRGDNATPGAGDRQGVFFVRANSLR